MLFGGLALLTLAMAACDGKDCKGGSCANKDVDKVYTGVLPAADTDGVRYTLRLDYDDNGMKGDYDLVETYLQADSLSTVGYKDARSFTSEGDFKVEKKGDKTYLQLIKDQKDSSIGSAETPMYFVVDSDSTLTMTNASLEVSTTPGMNYTLKLAQ